MTEDNFEEFLKKAAQGYNVPPARTPREDMWSAIQSQRSAGPRIVYGGLPARQLSGRRFGSRIWMGAAAAAVLLLATGVGLGRWSASTDTTPSVAAVTSIKGGLPPAPIEGTATSPAPVDAGAVEPSQAGGGTKTSSPAAALASQEGRRTGARSGNPTAGAPGGPSINSAGNSATSSAYQITAVRHLSEAEALLTSFRTRSTTDQQMDAQLGSWARQLLSNTRLLLDSPVANDPQRRPLLEDLELVLVQIVQLSPGSTPQDRELIEKTLQQDHVMTRLRTAIPAGSQRGS
jgi:hypothetical protein